MFRIFCLLLLIFSCSARREWDDKDYEIFDLHDSLSKLYPNSDFYSVLSLPRTASIAQITKSYRKTSLQYHPDKNDDPAANALYQLLTSISTILKDSESRDKYDGHLARGFPIWRGTGYYYKKFHPGVVTVAFIVIFFISFVQYASAWGIYYLNIAIAKGQHEELLLQAKKRKSNNPIVVPDLKMDFVKPSISDIAVFKIPLSLFGRKKTIEKNEDDQPVIVKKKTSKLSKNSKGKKELKKEFDNTSDFIE